MKLKHALSLLSVAAVGLAFAAPAMAKEPQPAASIIAPANLTPTVVAGIGYPYLASIYDLRGECRVSVDVANGAVSDVRVLHCTSGYFRNEARRAASQLRFAQTAQAQDAVIVVRWASDTQRHAVMVANR